MNAPAVPTDSSAPPALALGMIDDLAAGLARDNELSALAAHAFTLQYMVDESKTFLHHRNLSPPHQHLSLDAESVTHVSGYYAHLPPG
ncbi:hypothetical protein QA646_03570 [Rhizobium sp. CB3090]|uniref:hypothetical protein n=1 Tax=Rhizobium sp. CB3090 TaxID=3039156 RepID=UPI0024B0A756|nr:hypothetical protein [Rhizobium sp. CB3090]WFU09957.1 hypothetical protein QA646_03570 [Rhizobium sp. CB3090]